jgi:hypothetical protein
MIHFRAKATALAATVSLSLLAPDSLAGQAICSAPHSSPTLTQTGSLGTLPPGGGWIQISGYGQNTRRFFSPDGDRQPFLADSEFTTRSLFLTGAVGVLEGVEVWGQVTGHRLRVESAGGNSRSSGPGDLRLAARISPRIMGFDFPAALRLGVKLPGSDFPVDATVLPLTEGQRDWEVTLESGHSFEDRPLYVIGWIGFRWREANEGAARDPGDEAFGHLALGGTVGPLAWEVAGDGLWGRAPLAQGFLLKGDARRLVQVLPILSLPMGPGRIEAGAQFPVLGKNLPVGTGFSLGYRFTWGLMPDPAAALQDFLGDPGLLSSPALSRRP